MSTKHQGKALEKSKLTAKQKKEWDIFLSFQRDYPLPNGVPRHSDKPDVVIDGDRTLGIELTRFYIEDGQNIASEQIQAKLRQDVITRAQEIHRQAGRIPIELVVGFNPRYPIDNIGETASAIANIAALVQHGFMGQIESLTYEHLCQVNFMYVSGEYATPLWRVQQSYYVPMLQTQRVREIVAEKIERAKKYQKLDAIWLVITVDFWDPAQDQDIEWPAGECINCGPYERVFLYSSAYRRVVEIPQG